MKYCLHCKQDIQTKESYGWQTWLIGLVVWVVGSFLFKAIGFSSGGFASFGIGCAIAGMSAKKFKKYRCTTCKNRIGTAPKETNDQPTKGQQTAHNLGYKLGSAIGTVLGTKTKKEDEKHPL
jgi:hypothetical protein